jgi:hypothetical protein
MPGLSLLTPAGIGCLDPGATEAGGGGKPLTAGLSGESGQRVAQAKPQVGPASEVVVSAAQLETVF